MNDCPFHDTMASAFNKAWKLVKEVKETLDFVPTEQWETKKAEEEPPEHDDPLESWMDDAAEDKEEKEGELKVRYLALHHLQSVESRASVARIVLRKWQTIDEWQRKFKEEGLNGLKRKAGQGRKSKLKKSEEERFKKRLNEI